MGIKSIVGTVGTCLAVVSLNVSAAVLSGNYTTDDGKVVALQGLEWLSADTTLGLSRSTVNGMLDTLEGGGWEYASDLQTSTLLQSLYGGTNQFTHVTNYDGAKWFGENFFNVTGNYDHLFFYGLDSDAFCHNGSSHCLGNVAVISGTNGWFFDGRGLAVTSNTLLTADDSVSNRYGSLLVRTTVVPVPSAVWLFGSGLFGLIGIARRKV